MNRPVQPARIPGRQALPPANNHFPWWKNLLIVIVVVLSVIYAIPNFYKPDPAVQVSGASGSSSIVEEDLQRAQAALDHAGITHFGGELQKNALLVRLHNMEDQLAAKAVLEATLGGDYVVAVNLAPTTPPWLMDIGAQPMKLGLDLSGGVHFLLEVDTDEMIKTRFNTMAEEMQRTLRDADLPNKQWKIDVVDRTIQLRFADDASRDAANTVLKTEFPNLERLFTKQGSGIDLNLSDASIREIEDYAVTQNLTSLRNRVDELGVSEPIVQRQGRNRIVVELPGVQDTAQAKRIIGKTANLEFRFEAESSTLLSRREQYRFRNDERLGAWLEKKIIVTGDRVTDARSSFDPETSLPQVNITLDSDGGEMMNRATRNNVGRRMGVLFIESKTDTVIHTNEQGEKVPTQVRRIEKSLINLATVQSALGVQFRITGLDSVNEASELALLLRAGALAAPITFVEERTVGPSMGAENIRAGMISSQVGFALVMLFVLIYYRFFGLAANAALLANLSILVACMSLFGATLTMPGIAGIVLSIGMAVDANVLIYSRIKEELANGTPPQQAIVAGYDRAFITIFDSNLTTLLAAVILFAIGTGPIQGFAVTLSIGILASMFTAITLTRAIVNAWYGGKNVATLSI